MIIAVTCVHISCVHFVYIPDFDAELNCLGVLTYNAKLQVFEHGYKYIYFVLVSNVLRAHFFSLHFYI